MPRLRVSMAGTVILALLGGLSGAVVAQSEASEPTTPAFFEVVGFTDTDLVTTDPRFGGTFVASNPDIYPIGHDADHVSAGLVHLENDEGSWVGWSTGFSWLSQVPWHEQMWLVGEGAYEGLSAVAVSECDRLPCDHEDIRFEGIIFDGEVPPLWAPAE